MTTIEIGPYEGIRVGPDGPVEGGIYSIDLDDYRTTGLRIAILGSSGTGKGYLLGKVLEGAIAAHLPTVMLDAEHELWTFKEVGALVVGGREGDAPFVDNPDAIDEVLRWGIDTATPIVFDVGEMAEADEAEASRLGELVMRRLYMLADRDRQTVVFGATEAGVFAPQAVTRGGREPTMMRQIYQRGRKRGILPVVETQRIADIQKRVISEANLPFYGSINRDRDFQAIAKDVAPLSFADLRALPQGVFYVQPVGKPGVAVRVGRRSVTHGGGTPEDGGEVRLAHERRSSADLVGVIEALRAAAERAPDAPQTDYPGGKGKTAPTPAPRDDRALREAERRVLTLTDERDAAVADAAQTRRERDRSLQERDAALLERNAANNARIDLARSIGSLRDGLVGLLGEGVPLPVAGMNDEAAIGTFVREEVARQVSRLAPTGPGPALAPVEALRDRYLEQQAVRLVDIVEALDPHERAGLMFLIAHPEGVTTTALTLGITGSNSGSTVRQYGDAVQRLISKGLAEEYGSGRAKRRATVDRWIKSGLGPHNPTDEDVERVRDRALAVLAEHEQEQAAS